MDQAVSYEEFIKEQQAKHREEQRKNLHIFIERRKKFNSREGARVGDYLLKPDGKYTRFTYFWECDGQMQTGGSSGNAYYLGNGYLDYSGSLNSGLNINCLEQTKELKAGQVWFFKDNRAGAGRGINFSMNFRVFRIREGAEYKEHLL